MKTQWSVNDWHFKEHSWDLESKWRRKGWNIYRFQLLIYEWMQVWVIQTSLVGTTVVEDMQK